MIGENYAAAAFESLLIRPRRFSLFLRPILKFGLAMETIALITVMKKASSSVEEPCLADVSTTAAKFNF